MLDIIFKIIGYSFAYLNTLYLKLFLGKIGRGSLIFKHSRILSPSRIKLGKKCIILHDSRIEVIKNKDASLMIGDRFHAGNKLFISCASNITIGNGVLFSDNIGVIDNTHIDLDLNVSVIDQGITCKRITIGDNVTVYRNATILEGVIIGDGAIIGANSLVKSNVAANTIVAGSPARVIGHRK